MKTTDLFVEQVIAGLLVMLAFALLIAPEPEVLLQGIGVVEGALLFGGAYLIGIVADRCADTLVEDLEQHHRIRFGLKRWRRLKEKTDKDVAPSEDPHPEDDQRAALLLRDTSMEYAGYIRTRMRLARVLTILLPALTAGFLAWTLRLAPLTIARLGLVAATLLAYAAAFLVGFLPGRRKAKPPKTYDLKDAGVYAAWAKGVTHWHAKGWPEGGEWRLLFANRGLGWFALLLALAGAVVAVRREQPLLILVPLVGLVATLLVGWTWWRVLETFYSFLVEQPPAPKP